MKTALIISEGLIIFIILIGLVAIFRAISHITTPIDSIFIIAITIISFIRPICKYNLKDNDNRP